MVTSAALILSILYIIFLELVSQLYGGREILNIGSAFLITVNSHYCKKALHVLHLIWLTIKEVWHSAFYVGAFQSNTRPLAQQQTCLIIFGPNAS